MSSETPVHFHSKSNDALDALYNNTCLKETLKHGERLTMLATKLQAYDVQKTLMRVILKPPSPLTIQNKYYDHDTIEYHTNVTCQHKISFINAVDKLNAFAGDFHNHAEHNLLMAEVLDCLFDYLHGMVIIYLPLDSKVLENCDTILQKSRSKMTKSMWHDCRREMYRIVYKTLDDLMPVMQAYSAMIEKFVNPDVL